MIKPRAGLQVPFPDHSGYLPEGGISVKLNAYFQRLLKNGDVEIITTTSKQTKKKG